MLAGCQGVRWLGRFGGGHRLSPMHLVFETSVQVIDSPSLWGGLLVCGRLFSRLDAV